ncbi:glycoside hydrolase family 16 protein [Nocardiopsis sp. HNM0947]|uniref:Glycoside hydrolase family 16 protein n=1 Tax=Nocardiopsis coralli TaxID=2772213 RepID=A0ABR9P4G3_9ACTN|nr:glycoside hydrolase family 16 protein [Nocardiopsis coralli]MBE2998734.1 glycoside hydrolase family 16 protein [Nocardiopsis coralli]
MSTDNRNLPRTSRRTRRRAGRYTVPALAAGAAVALTATALTWGDDPAVNIEPVSNDAPEAAQEAELVWSDEFEGSEGDAPDPDNWNHETGDHGWGNEELQNYTESRDNSALDGDGNLVITALDEGDEYTSARMTTQGNMEHEYGRVEARIQLPEGQGIWPAFWMLGSEFPETPWPDSGEIDVMEFIGHETGTVHGTVHGPGYSGGDGVGSSYDHPDGGSFADDFHTYAIDWEPGSITWSVDDVPFNTITADDVDGDWVFDQEFFLILNVAVGGEWPGYPDDSTEFPQQMVVDHVRVYDMG